MTPAPPSRPVGVMAGFTKVGGLRPPQSGGVVGAEGQSGAWAGAGGGSRRLRSSAERGGRRYSPGLRVTPVALRSEPGITSARTLRGSEGVSPSGENRGNGRRHLRRGEGQHRGIGGRQHHPAGRGGTAGGTGGRKRHPARTGGAAGGTGRRQPIRRPGGWAGRTEPRSVRGGGNRGSERAWASRRDSVVMTARGGDPG